MKKYEAQIEETTITYVLIRAENQNEAEEKAKNLLKKGEYGGSMISLGSKLKTVSEA